MRGDGAALMLWLRALGCEFDSVGDLADGVTRIFFMLPTVILANPGVHRITDYVYAL